MYIETGMYCLVAIDVFFSESIYTVNETGRHVQPVLVLSNPSSTDVTVEVTLGKGTATGKLTNSNIIVIVGVCITGGGVDYDSGPFDIRFPAGETLAIFNVSINDDDIVEGNENFNISIDPFLLPNGVSVGDPSQTTVIIVDDDCK